MGKIPDYFNNLLSGNEITEIQRKIADIDNNSELEKEMQSVFDDIDLLDDEATKYALDKVKDKIFRTDTSAKSGSRFFRIAIRTAAVLFFPLAVLTGLLAYRTYAEDLVLKEILVPYGQTRELRLSDGTMLQLNSGTRVTYPEYFKGKNRQIFVDGEILAEVAKDPHKPFVIKSGNVAVKVLGTKFDFKSYSEDDNVELMLLEGAVQFGIDAENQKQNIAMRPGDMVQYAKTTGAVNVRKLKTDSFRTFKDDNAIQFSNITLADIANELERTFGQEIVLLDNNIASTRYLAYFTNNETLDQILATINADTRIKIKKENGVIYISSRK